MAASTFGCGRSAKQYLDQGNQLFSAGKYDDASLNYRNALKKDPKSGEAYYRLALAQLKLAKLPDAYQALNRAVELSPQNAPAKAELAAISLTAYARDPRRPAALYNRAAALTHELLTSNPKSADGLRLKGEIAIVDKRYKEAMEALRQAQQSSGAPENQFELAEAMLLDNQPEEAERQAKEAIARHPAFTPTYDLLYALFLRQERWAEAESLLRQRIASNPKDAAGVVRLAAFYLGRKRPEDAEKTLDSGLLGHRDVFPQADLLAGDFHALARHWDTALADYQRGASRDAPRYQAYQERIAMALATLGRRDEALKAIDGVLAKDPKDTPVRALKVSILTAKGGAENVKTAANLAAELAQEFPGRLQIQMLAAQAAAANGEVDAATARLQQAAKIDQKFLPARLALARIYLLRRDYPAMLEQANAALSINGDDDNARLLHIMALTGTKSFAQAKNEAEQLSGSSNRRQGEMQLGVIALSQQHYAEAEAHFQKLYREGGDDLQPLAGLVSAYMGEHMPDRALQLLEEEKKRAPGSVGTEALLAATAQATGNLGLALSQMQDIASQAPSSVAVQLRIADLERKQGNLPAALAALERARQLQPGAKGVDAAIASVQDELGRKADAVASYRKALAQSPDDPAVLNNLAYLLAETGGDLNEAQRLVTAGLRKAPDNPSLQDTLAWIDTQKGQTAAALPILSSLIGKNPSDVTFRYHYAVALFRSGDAEHARRQAETALSNQPSPAMQDQIRKLLAQLR